MSRGPLRAVRAAVLAAACAAVAWSGHAFAGADAVHPWALAAAAAALWPAMLAFTRARRGFTGILGALTAAQIPLHLLFTAGGTAATAALPAPAHAAHTTPADHLAALSYDPAMLCAHLWAALVAAALIARGEDALAILVWLLTATLPRLLRPAALPASAVPARRAPAAPPRPPHRSGHRPDRPRGPPVR